MTDIQVELLRWEEPLTKVRWHQDDVYGDAVYGGRRTIAHLEYTAQRSEKRFGHRVEVLQGSFNADVPASAGTHDFDAVMDFFIPGDVDWWAQQRFFRECGWGCWYRYPPAFPRHLHGISLGFGNARVGVYVPGQVDDYHNHAFGLSGMHTPNSDDSWFPPDISDTVFNYRRWAEDQEDKMPLNADDKAWVKDAIADAVKANNETLIEALLSTRIELEDQPKLSVRGALRRVAASSTSTLVKAVSQKIEKKIDGGVEEIDAPCDQV